MSEAKVVFQRLCVVVKSEPEAERSKVLVDLFCSRWLQKFPSSAPFPGSLCPAASAMWSLLTSDIQDMQALPKKEIDKVEKHVFRVYDTNGDGFIDFIEFMVLFHILSGKTLDS